jgi:hypothetical protein
MAHEEREASWSAPALWRFETGTLPQPIAHFNFSTIGISMDSLL